MPRQTSFAKLLPSASTSTLPKDSKKSSRQTSAPKEPSKCKHLSYFLPQIFLIFKSAAYAQNFNLFKMLTLFFLYSFRLVGGAGQVKLTKDGRVLLHEMVSNCVYFPQNPPFLKLLNPYFLLANLARKKLTITV